MSNFFKELLAEHDIEQDIELEPVEPETPKLPKDWVPPPRIQTPHRENSDHATFRIGAWDYHRPWWWRLALPWPRWPEPGAVATPEIETAYDREQHLALEAEEMLGHYLRFVAAKHLQPNFFDVGIDNCEELAAERLAWLKGVWTSRGFKCPDEHEFIAMAIEPKPPQPGPKPSRGKDAESIGSSG